MVVHVLSMKWHGSLDDTICSAVSAVSTQLCDRDHEYGDAHLSAGPRPSMPTPRPRPGPGSEKGDVTKKRAKVLLGKLSMRPSEQDVAHMIFQLDNDGVLMNNCQSVHLRC